MTLNRPPASTKDVLEKTLQTLTSAQARWATRSVHDKRADLATLLTRTADAAADWVSAAIEAKGVPRGSAGEGEEWISGPWAMESALAALLRTLERVEKKEPSVPAEKVRSLPSGQVVVDVFPATVFDKLLLSGYTAEVWMQPSVTSSNVTNHMAVAYAKPDTTGGLALVLGAGNIASIPPLDVIYELVAENRVALCKMNPINDYLGPIFERIFAPMIEQGFVAFVYGGAEVGAPLVNDARVSKVHITGSAKSHDTIVYGPGEAGAARKAKKDPLLTKPITSELGGVGPVIIVPGPWTDADLQFQAEHVVTQKLHNNGFNCIAAQVIVLHQEWELREKFLSRVEATMRTIAPRPAYYPGAKDRQTEAAAAHKTVELIGSGEVPMTRIQNVDSRSNDSAFQTEYFGSTWAETTISASDAAAFLKAAVTFANEKLMGTLGAQILIHPITAHELGPKLEEAIAELKYGTIGINAWSGVGFLLSNAAWGAYPGHPLEDIQSGRGVVHNAFLLDQTQKTVVRAPFAPFPRSVTLGELHMSPKPPWFVTNKNAATLGRLLSQFEAAPSFLKLPAIFAAALTG